MPLDTDHPYNAEYRVASALLGLGAEGARWNDLYMTTRQTTPPPSFHYDYSDDWGVWVLYM